MEFRLNPDEQQFLLEILEERQRELLHEINRADDRRFKHMLQHREQMLESLLNQVRLREEVPA